MTNPLPTDPRHAVRVDPVQPGRQGAHDAAVSDDDDVATRRHGQRAEHVVGEAGYPPVKVADGLAARGSGVGVDYLVAVDPGDRGPQDPRRGPPSSPKLRSGAAGRGQRPARAERPAGPPSTARSRSLE